MASPESLIVRAFAGGELSPALAARADLAKYAIGLRTCRNFTVQRHGGVANRAGFRFVEACKTTSAHVTLLPYHSEIAGESLLLEMGIGYLRVYQQGAQLQIDPSAVSAWSGGTDYVIGDLVSSGGVVYYAKQDHTNEAPPNTAYWHAMVGDVFEIPSPFTDPLNTKWVQSGRVITFTHPSVRPHDLIHGSLTSWAMRPVVTAPKIAPPDNLALTNPGTGTRSFGYVVTAAAPGTYEESEASAQVIHASAGEPTPDSPHTLTWDAVLTPPLTGDPSPEYYVYCDPYGNGTYGFLGTATGAATFHNPGLTPDFNITPPLPRELFNAAGEYPSVAAYHQQRRFFAGPNAAPDGVYASRVGLPDNFGISSPLQDDDAITFRIAGNHFHPVRWLVGLKQLLIMTDAGEWRMLPAGGVLAPNTLEFDQETYVGVSRLVRPVVIGNAIIYLQARESIIRDLRFDQEVEGFGGRDLTVFAGHLFDGYAIRSMDYAQSPHSILWACRSDGTLLGLTYIREQDLVGWHRHDTGAGGRFESVCVVPEPGEDAVYVIVRRTLGSSTVRYIERLEAREITTWNEDVFFVDSGLSYSGTPVASVAGLGHLEGQTVAIVADGEARGTAVVSGGAVSVGTPAANIHVGLPITAEIETLDLDVAGTAIRDKVKRIASLTVLIDQSSRSFFAGPDAAHLLRYRPSPWDGNAAAHTGQVELSLQSRFRVEGRVLIRQTDPLPLTVLGVIPRVELGG